MKSAESNITDIAPRSSQPLLESDKVKHYGPDPSLHGPVKREERPLYPVVANDTANVARVLESVSAPRRVALSR